LRYHVICTTASVASQVHMLDSYTFAPVLRLNAVACLTFAVCFCTTTCSSNFLVGRSLNGTADSTVFEKEIQTAVSEALGCGGQASAAQLEQIRTALMPTWRTLPKNRDEQIDRSSFRYLARRYFLRTGLMIRGFEANRVVNSSNWGAADILSQRVPDYVESVLESRHAQERGFSLEDGVTLIATISQLIFDSESTTLEKAYTAQRIPLSRNAGRGEVQNILEAYMVQWMAGEDQEVVDLIAKGRVTIEDALPRWTDIKSFVRGQLAAFDHRRGQLQSAMFQSGYTFQDVHEVVGEVTRSFALFWESECEGMKAQLIAMDSRGTGRVPLSRFYATSLEDDWRFGESEAYLQELGALDETSLWYGKEVIIPNYMQGTSNCIVATPHYHVCCLNLCEEILGDIEASLKSPTASPSDILRVVSTLTAPSSVDEEGLPHLHKAVVQQLQEVAEAHGGKVPVHGRLFQQWLHFVFPRECIFPHRAGVASSVRPAEFGEFMATDEEKKKYASEAGRHSVRLPSLNESADWMSQWSSEEELFAEIRPDATAVDASSLLFGLMVLAIGGTLAGILGLTSKTQTVKKGQTHSHYV